MATIQQTVVTKVELDNSQYVGALETQEDAQDDANEATEEGTAATGAMTGALDGMAGQLGINIGALKGTAKGLSTAVKGFKSLKVAIIATGIGALIIALGSMLAFLNSTAEGQEKLALATRTVGEVFNQLKEIFIDAGEAIFNALSNPKKAVIDLWEAIKTNLVNRVTALPKVFSAAFKIIQKTIKLDFSGAKEEMEGLARASIQLTTGLNEAQQDGALDYIANKTKEIKENVEAATKLQRESNALRRDQIAFITREAELNRDIAEARLLGNDATLTNQQQLDGINKAVALTNTLTKERRGLLSAEIDQLQRTQDLGSNTLEDNEELARLKARLINLDTAAAGQLRSLAGRQKALNAAVESELNTTIELVAIKDEAAVKDEARSQKALESIDALNLKEEERRAKTIEDEELQAVLLIDIEKRKLASLLENETLYQEERDALLLASAQKVEAIERESAAKIKTRDAAGVSQQKKNQKSIEANTLASFKEIAALNKETALVNTAINIAEGISAAWKLGFPAGIPGALAVAASGAVQIAAIKSEQFALGGYLRGARHSTGGIDINAEDGEVIITRNAVAKHLPLLSAINQDGGGIPLAQKGMLVGQAESRNALSGLGSSFDASLENNRPVLVTEDLEAVQGRVQATEDISTL